MSKRILFLSFFILSLGFRILGQNINPPTILCVTTVGTDIIVNWGLPAGNNCGPFVNYTIYASTSPTGPFTNAATITNPNTIADTLVNYIAGNNLTWYVYMVSNYNCPGGTVISSDTINNQLPVTPRIIDVTVLPNGQAQITYAPSASPQTTHYIVYYSLGNATAIAWDTVYGYHNTTVTDTTTVDIYDPTQHSISFTVTAVDSCGNRSSFNTLPQHTILATATNTECQRQVNITWNQYVNWPQGVKDYQVWVSKNGGAFVMDGTADTATLSYAYTNFNTGDTLQIFIRAISTADTTIVSNSNIVYLKAVIVQPPSYIYLTNLTVNAANQIYFTWTIDTIAQLIFYKILQSTDSVLYNPTDQIPVPTPLQHFQTFGDSDYVFPQNNPYYFEIDAYDSCQNQYISPFGKTVCLQGGLYDYYVVKLTWNDFELSYANVLQYNLYRDFGNGFQLIKTFQPGINQYFDSLQNFLNEQGTFCYRIEAVYSISLPSPSGYQATLVSASNQLCVVHRPVIYVPNAFAPGGGVAENMTFKPTIIYGAPKAYSLIIYNRWGGKIFESDEPSLGWDGTDHGKAAEMGGYAYLINFTADDGTPIERKGIVLLVR